MIMMRNRSATDVAQMFIQYEKGTPEFFDNYHRPVCATSGCPDNKKHRDINSACNFLVILYHYITGDGRSDEYTSWPQ